MNMMSGDDGVEWNRRPKRKYTAADSSWLRRELQSHGVNSWRH